MLGLCLTAPGLAIPELDWRFRIGLAVALGLVLVPVVEPLIVAPAGWQSMASAIVLELLAGAVLGYLAATIVAGARMAGELVAAQAGLSTSTLLDPETGDEIGPLGRLYGWIAVVAFLGLGGPLILVKALVESYEAVPAGGLLISAETAELAFGQVGHALELALRAAAPVALALALAGIIMGWLSRAALLASLRRPGAADPHADRRRPADPQPGHAVSRRSPVSGKESRGEGETD